jgi:hypothetical protein
MTSVNTASVRGCLVATWHLDVTEAEEREVQEVARMLSEATGVRMSRAGAIRWAVSRVARQLREDPERLS